MTCRQVCTPMFPTKGQIVKTYLNIRTIKCKIKGMNGLHPMCGIGGRWQREMVERLLRPIFAVPFRAISSVGSERSPHTRKVTGSNPVLPTTAPAPASRGFFLPSPQAAHLCREAP